jgi:hypothetical protein
MSKSGPFIANGYVENRGSTTMHEIFNTSGYLYTNDAKITPPSTNAFTAVGTTDTQTIQNKTFGSLCAVASSNGSTAANLHNYGMSLLTNSTSSTKAYTINPPDTGVRKTLILQSTFPADTTGVFATVYSGSTAIIFFDNSTTVASAQKLYLGLGPPLACFEMIGVSTANWAILNAYGNAKTSTSATFSS